MTGFLRIIIIIPFESVSFPRSRQHSLYKSASGEEESLLNDSSCEAIFKPLVIDPLNSNTQRYQGNTVGTSSKVMSIALCIPAKYSVFSSQSRVRHSTYSFTMRHCSLAKRSFNFCFQIRAHLLLIYLFIIIIFLIRDNDSTLEFHNATLKSSVTVTFICILITHASLLILWKFRRYVPYVCLIIMYFMPLREYMLLWNCCLVTTKVM